MGQVLVIFLGTASTVSVGPKAEVTVPVAVRTGEDRCRPVSWWLCFPLVPSFFYLSHQVMLVMCHGLLHTVLPHFPACCDCLPNISVDAKRLEVALADVLEVELGSPNHSLS